MTTPIRLTKTDIARRDELIESARTARSTLDDAIDAYNKAVAAAYSELSEAVTAYNEHIADVNGFAQDIASELREACDERSESWADSTAGQTANDFVETWEGVSFDDFEVSEPDEVEAPDSDVAEELEALDVKPE